MAPLRSEWRRFWEETLNDLSVAFAKPNQGRKRLSALRDHGTPAQRYAQHSEQVCGAAAQCCAFLTRRAQAAPFSTSPWRLLLYLEKEVIAFGTEIDCAVEAR